MFARGRAIAAAFLAGSLLAGCAGQRASEPAVPNAAIAPPPVEAAPSLPAPASQTAAAALDEAGVRARYGEPDFIRKETDSQLWRYDGADCALFLFLYRENETYRLRYMESLPRGADGAADPACAAGIRARGAPSS